MTALSAFSGVPEIGSAAPDFSLRSQHGEPTSLADLRGRSAALLVFYPFAFSRICTGELGELREDLAAFQNDAVQVMGISCDPMHSLRAYAETEGYDFPLLSDFWPHGAVARSYGVFRDEVGAAIRGSFLIDRSGILRWRVVHEIGEARDLAGYHEALAAL